MADKQIKLLPVIGAVAQPKLSTIDKVNAMRDERKANIQARREQFRANAADRRKLASPEARGALWREQQDAAKKMSMPKMAKGGMVKANCGASVPPAQKGKK